MKIYINNFNLDSLPKIQKSLTDILFETQNYIEVYTNEAMYHIDCKNIYFLQPKDGEIIIYKNYFNNITLVVDNSYFNKIIETSVNGIEHLHKKIIKFIYKLNPKSELSFIIEMVSNLYSNILLPNDVYFECNELIDIKEIFIKQEIIEFLSLLN
jgi:hypothetical protein